MARNSLLRAFFAFLAGGVATSVIVIGVNSHSRPVRTMQPTTVVRSAGISLPSLDKPKPLGQPEAQTTPADDNDAVPAQTPVAENPSSHSTPDAQSDARTASGVPARVSHASTITEKNQAVARVEPVAVNNGAVSEAPVNKAPVNKAIDPPSVAAKPAPVPPPCPCPAAALQSPVTAPAQMAAVQPREPAPLLPAPAPRIVKSVVLGPGTPISVRLDHALSTHTDRAGERFAGVLTEPIIIDGLIAAEGGARVEGLIIESEHASHFHMAHISMVLTGINAVRGQFLAVRSQPIDIDGKNRAGVQGLKTGASSTVGGVASTFVGHDSGEALGSFVGGVIGTSGAILTGGKAARITPQQTLRFRLVEPVAIEDPTPVRF